MMELSQDLKCRQGEGSDLVDRCPLSEECLCGQIGRVDSTAGANLADDRRLFRLDLISDFTSMNFDIAREI